MKMLNAEVNGFIKFLMSLELSGRDSRMRTRFCKLAQTRLDEINEERTELIKQYGVVDEDGNIKKEERDGVELFVMKDRDAFNREYEIMMLEEFVIDETEERKEMLVTVHNIVLNADVKLSGQDALIYDRYCEIVESIHYK
jgi:hypothetical protein